MQPPHHNLLTSHVFYACQFEISSLRITACSPALASALGDFSPENWIGNYVLSIFSPSSFKDIENLICHQATSQSCYCHLATQDATHSNVVVTMEMNTTEPAEGIATLICIPIEDQQDQIRSLSKELSTVNKHMEDLSDLTKLVIHDIKGSLQVIIGSLELIHIKGINSLYIHNDMQRIEKTTQHMNLMLTEISKYTRYDIGDYPPELTDMNALVDSVIANIKDMSQKDTSIQRLTDLPDLLCEKALIRELFQNLVENSVIYSDKQRTVVDIGVVRKDDEYNFFVRDNGVGINEDDFEVIFSLLKRSDTQQLNPHGTGMGLSYVKKIVQRHQGKIWLESTVGLGTTMWFSLMDKTH